MRTNAKRLIYILGNCKYLMLGTGVLLVFFNITNMKTLSSVITAIWVLLTFLCNWFNTSIWKNEKIIKVTKGNKKIYCPKISGRWEGHLTRDGKEHDFVIEIKQTYTTVSCSTYSNHSNSNSWCADILYDEQKERYLLVYLWQGKSTRNPAGEEEPSNYFYGTTILEINDECNKLTGDYYTDREPDQTKGKINLIYRQEKLENAFKA